MKCEKCGAELSPRVWEIHYPKCTAKIEKPVINMDNPYAGKTHNELKQIAKDRGIDRYWFKSAETLEQELLEGDAVD